MLDKTAARKIAGEVSGETVYRITFIDASKNEHVVAVDPARTPHSGHGEAGSLLDIALASGIDIDHACGGVCACSTCHVIIRQGYDACNEPDECEEDRLDEAYGVSARSRLACQCVPNGTTDLIVEIPRWNRNLIREGQS